jgi:hypothetical protein
MTAREHNDTESDNSGVTDSEVDAQRLYNYLRRRDGGTLEGLAKRVGVTEDRLRSPLEDLEARGLINVRPRMHSVRIDVIEQDRNVATDGGLFEPPFAHGIDERGVSIDEDQLWNVLSNSRRRTLLQFLATIVDDGETYLEVRPVAIALAQFESGMPVGEVTDNHLSRMYVALTQQHLPELAELGLVEYYERPKKLAATKKTFVAAAIIHDVRERCRPGRGGDHAGDTINHTVAEGHR